MSAYPIMNTICIRVGWQADHVSTLYTALGLVLKHILKPLSTRSFSLIALAITVLIWPNKVNKGRTAPGFGIISHTQVGVKNAFAPRYEEGEKHTALL